MVQLLPGDPGLWTPVYDLLSLSLYLSLVAS